MEEIRFVKFLAMEEIRFVKFLAMEEIRFVKFFSLFKSVDEVFQPKKSSVQLIVP